MVILKLAHHHAIKYSLRHAHTLLVAFVSCGVGSPSFSQIPNGIDDTHSGVSLVFLSRAAASIAIAHGSSRSDVGTYIISDLTVGKYTYLKYVGRESPPVDDDISELERLRSARLRRQPWLLTSELQSAVYGEHWNLDKNNAFIRAKARTRLRWYLIWSSTLQKNKIETWTCLK